MELDPGIHIVMHSVLSLKPGATFPEQIRKPVADEQFGKFVEVIKKLYVNIPLLDAM